MHASERLANLLCATALALTDLSLAGATRAAGVSASAAAALVALSESPDLGVTELGRRVGLTQSAAARMVDSLQAGALVRRRAGQGRTVSVRLTSTGTRAVGELRAARAAPSASALAALDEADQATLARLLETMLGRLYHDIGDADLMCRLCDRAGCTAGAPCPVGAAERAAGR